MVVEDLGRLRGHFGAAVFFGIGDVIAQEVHGEGGALRGGDVAQASFEAAFRFVLDGDAAADDRRRHDTVAGGGVSSIHVDDGAGDSPIQIVVGPVVKDEHQIESGQNGRLDVQIFRHRLAQIVISVAGVGRRHHRAPGWQRGHDPGLGHRYLLLLHGLQQSVPVGPGGFVELVDAADALVGEHQGPRLDGHLPVGVPAQGHGEPGFGGGVSGDVDAPVRGSFGGQEHLALAHAGISHHEDVDVAPQGGVAGGEDGGSAEEGEEHSRLDAVVAHDGGTEGAHEEIEGEGAAVRHGSDFGVGVGQGADASELFGGERDGLGSGGASSRAPASLAAGGRGGGGALAGTGRAFLSGALFLLRRPAYRNGMGPDVDFVGGIFVGLLHLSRLGGGQSADRPYNRHDVPGSNGIDEIPEHFNFDMTGVVAGGIVKRVVVCGRLGRRASMIVLHILQLHLLAIQIRRAAPYDSPRLPVGAPFARGGVGVSARGGLGINAVAEGPLRQPSAFHAGELAARYAQTSPSHAHHAPVEGQEGAYRIRADGGEGGAARGGQVHGTDVDDGRRGREAQDGRRGVGHGGRKNGQGAVRIPVEEGGEGGGVEERTSVFAVGAGGRAVVAGRIEIRGVVAQ
mmetsp:Transcript_14169/g.30977  ORF Transcript_14169/g.30977 Transcript_14169/m.30977 type:complete len:625 (+) Transcript_14169:188-2062(+)